MKIMISFICGAVICYLLVIGLRPSLPAMADESDNTTSSDSNFLSDLLPDFDKIYRESLAEPFIKAESKIYDDDIADYYHGLMEKTGLTNPYSD